MVSLSLCDSRLLFWISPSGAPSLFLQSCLLLGGDSAILSLLLESVPFFLVAHLIPNVPIAGDSVHIVLYPSLLLDPPWWSPNSVHYHRHSHAPISRPIPLLSSALSALFVCFCISSVCNFVGLGLLLFVLGGLPFCCSDLFNLKEVSLLLLMCRPLYLVALLSFFVLFFF